MAAATNSNESYCTFTLASDVTAGGLPSEEEIAKQLESSDAKVGIVIIAVLVKPTIFPKQFPTAPDMLKKVKKR